MTTINPPRNIDYHPKHMISNKKCRFKNIFNSLTTVNRTIRFDGALELSVGIVHFYLLERSKQAQDQLHY